MTNIMDDFQEIAESRSNAKPARTEIWLRKIHATFAESRRMTTIFRPNKRLISENHPQAFDVGEVVRIRVIANVGAVWAGVHGQLLPMPNIPVLITSVEVKQLGALKNEDFEGSTPDATDKDGLIWQLGLIYNLSLDDLSNDFWVTRSTFQYLDVLD